MSDHDSTLRLRNALAAPAEIAGRHDERIAEWRERSDGKREGAAGPVAGGRNE
ncbi:MAG TPA: hypothetical protein VN228_01425 [Pyrinomonadaceae bacterium]|nr:hypothetical protein [Pyrinomonadaceae bacterium]